MAEQEQERAAESGVLVIFGATGDLTRRKLVPALYNLHLDRLLPASVAVVGSSRAQLSSEDFRNSLRKGIEAHSRRPLETDAWNELASRISYVCSAGEHGYRQLAEHLDAVDRDQGTGGNRLFYLATPPSAFPVIVRQFGAAELNRPGRGGSWSRVVVEKPTGSDLTSARELNQVLNAVFEERDVYRIDHYLGKETVQNMLVFRFGNAIFEPLWNTKYVDHVQITVAESIGVEDRGAYYEEAGTTRDMVQNHMFQLLCLIAMEPPVSLRADAIRDEKVKVLEALRPVLPERIDEETVRAQYGAGVVGGKAVAGYGEEPGVAADSRTETYVALRLYIDNWRWAGVPVYLRAGKRMTKRVTEVALQFRDVPHRLFRRLHDRLVPNILRLRIQPDEGITLKFDAKVPGSLPQIEPVTMDFDYGSAFGSEPPAAYERLLLDALLGDSTLFIRRDEVEASWRWIDQLHEGWQERAGTTPLAEYTAGTWGPAEADVLLARDGRVWRRL